MNYWSAPTQAYEPTYEQVYEQVYEQAYEQVHGRANGLGAEVAGMGSVVTGRERLERYSLTGPENQAAVDAGLAGGAWFRSAVPRKRMKELIDRKSVV